MDERIGTLAWRHPRQPLQEAISFASRLAALNGRPMASFLREMGIEPLRLIRSDREEVRKLAYLSGDDPLQLTRETASRLHDRRFWIFGEERLAKRSIIRTVFRYCPRCIEEDLATEDGPLPGRPWLRTQWTIRNIRSCSRHRIMLADAFSLSGRSWMYDFYAAIEPALPHLSAVADHCSSTGRSMFEEWIVTRLGGRRDSELWLDGMELHVGIAFCEAIGVSASSPATTTWPNLTPSECFDAAETGFLIASRGPAAIEEELSRMNVRRRTSKGRWLPKETFGELYRVLNKSEGSSAWAVPLKLVSDFVLRSLPLEPGTTILGRTVERQNIHTVRSITKLSGSHQKTLRKFVERSNLCASRPMPGVSDSRITIVGRSIEETAIALRGAIGTPEVRRRTGFPLAWIRTAIADGHLPTVTGSEKVAYAQHRFTVESVDDMIRRMFDHAEDVVEPTETRLGVLAVQRKSGATASRLLAIVFGPTTIWKGRLTEGQGFDSLLLDIREINPLVRSEERGSGLGFRALQRFLPGIPSGCMKLLVSEGLLDSVEEFNPDARRMAAVVTRASAERFRSNYATVGDLSRVTGIGSQGVIRLLREARVDQVLTKNSHGFIAYIRSEAERALNLPANPSPE